MTVISNLPHVIVSIFNCYGSQVINFDKWLLFLIPYFYCFFHVSILVIEIKICTGLVSYIIYSKRLGNLSLSSGIESLNVPLISFWFFSKKSPFEPTVWEHYVGGSFWSHLQGTFTFRPLFKGSFNCIGFPLMALISHYCVLVFSEKTYHEGHTIRHDHSLEWCHAITWSHICSLLHIFNHLETHIQFSCRWL